MNPYNFVSIDTKTKQRWDIKNCYSGEEPLHTGYLQCKIIVKTPLAIPDSENRVLDGEHSRYPFYSVDGKKVIPGASIRGVLRSVYEAATDSCMVTVKESMGMTARINNRSAYKPGLLIREQDEWKLYKAKRYLIPVKGYKKFSTAGEVLDAGICVETQGGKRYLETENGERFSNGACVEFQLFPEPQPYNRRGHLVWNGVVQSMHASQRGNAYVYIGEKFGNKHGESLFQKTELVIKEQQVIDKAMKGLEETLKVYRDAAINREYGNSHSGYRNYEEAKKEGVIPIWYWKDENNQGLYFSAASIGRMRYKKSLSDLIGNKKPCKNRSSVCKACSLFGMAAKNEAIGSRVRIGDAIGKNCTVTPVTLQELGMPRSSYMPFYADSCKSYDETGAGIRGRKFYWHNPAAAEDASVYTAEIKTERNTTMELVMPGAEFDFRVYYDEITQKQLEELIWVITFWENESDGTLCHKLGHGKPLGLGSVKMIITEKVERSTDMEGYQAKIEKITLGKKIIIAGIYYGAFEVKRDDGTVPIFNLSRYSEILEWTSAADAFVSAGDSRQIKLLYDRKKKYLEELKKQQQTLVNIPEKNGYQLTPEKNDFRCLGEVICGIEDLTSCLETGRGKIVAQERAANKKSIYSAYFKLKESLKNISEEQRGMIRPLKPLFEEIEKSIEIFDVEKKNGLIGMASVEWAIRNHLLQQGYTALEETMKTVICELYGLRGEEEGERDIIVGSAMKMVSAELRKCRQNHKVLDRDRAARYWLDNYWDDQKEKQYPTGRRIGITVIQEIPEEYASLVNAVFNSRNSINHFGFQMSSQRYTKMESKLEEYYGKFKEFYEEWKEQKEN